jgi:hypothetical protein
MVWTPAYHLPRFAETILMNTMNWPDQSAFRKVREA